MCRAVLYLGKYGNTDIKNLGTCHTQPQGLSFDQSIEEQSQGTDVT